MKYRPSSEEFELGSKDDLDINSSWRKNKKTAYIPVMTREIKKIEKNLKYSLKKASKPTFPPGCTDDDMCNWKSYKTNVKCDVCQSYTLQNVPGTFLIFFYLFLYFFILFHLF